MIRKPTREEIKELKELNEKMTPTLLEKLSDDDLQELIEVIEGELIKK